MKLISWNIFPDEIEAYTVTKEFGDMSFNNEDKEHVLQNRIQLANYLNTSLDAMIAPRQVHSTNFREVSLKDGGKGMYHQEDAIANSDALYTRDKELYLVSFHADCTPILLYCRDQKIVCAIHSGWLGTTKEIVTKVVTHLIEKEHCLPENMYAYIGPCISMPQFEVKQDVIDLVKQMHFDTSSFYVATDSEHYHLDNKGLNMQQLLNLQIPKTNITISPYCTMEDNVLFYSHRKKESGRSITIIKRKESY